MQWLWIHVLLGEGNFNIKIYYFFQKHGFYQPDGLKTIINWIVFSINSYDEMCIPGHSNEQVVGTLIPLWGYGIHAIKNTSFCCCFFFSNYRLGGLLIRPRYWSIVNVSANVNRMHHIPEYMCSITYLSIEVCLNSWFFLFFKELFFAPAWNPIICLINNLNIFFPQ